MQNKRTRWWLGAIVLSVVLAGCGGTEAGVDEETGTRGGQVINGDQVVDTLPLGLVAVYHGYIRPCSGTVLDSNRGWVLTAAHCVTPDASVTGSPIPASSIQISQAVTAGLTPPWGALTASSVVTHGTLDLALIQVNGLTGTQGNGLWMAPTSTLVNRFLTCTGYGRFVQQIDTETEDGSTGAGTVRWAWLKAVGSSATQYQLSSNASSQILGHGDSGGGCFVQRWWDSDFGVLVTGAHSTSNSVSVSYDTAVAPGINWIGSTMGHLYIYRFRDGVSGRKYLDIQWGNSASGTPVWTWPLTDGSAQHWTYNSDTKAIVNENGKCLDVQWGTNANGTPVWMWDCNGGQAQQWEFTADLGIRNVMGRCLDVPNGDTGGGVPLQIWDCNASSAQRWFLSASTR